MVSVIIPSYKDPLLHKTIESLLDNCRGSIEVVVVLDGYEPEEEITLDRRVKVIDLPTNVGMREAINIGTKNARGEYIMRTDEHCAFSEGYDTALTETIEDNWIVTPRRYKLCVETWKPYGEPIDYEKLVIGRSVFGKKKGCLKFHTRAWESRSEARSHIKLDENMAFQGSCWLMSAKHWRNVIGRLQSEGYGTLYQDSTEMLFKTWQAGGKLMLNKNAWYAHRGREYKRTHRYPTRLAEASFKYALDKWGVYYKEVIGPRWEKKYP